MLKSLLVAIAILALVYPVVAAPFEQQGEAGEECEDCGPADDPVIYPGEVITTSSDWDDATPWGGNPPGGWFENPDSRNCTDNPEWCQEGNATVEGQ